VQAAQVVPSVQVTVSKALAVVWRFLYQLQSRLQTTERLAAVAVAVAVAAFLRFSMYSPSLTLTSAAEAGAEAEQEPLTLQVELAAIQAPTLVPLAELAQAEVVELEEMRSTMAAQAAIGVQQEALARAPLQRRRALEPLEARLAQPLAEIQTLHTWQQGQD
jgi:hypothetical protein